MFSDAAGPPVTGLTVAETHEVKVTARTENSVKGRDVTGTGEIVEDVKQTTI